MTRRSSQDGKRHSSTTPAMAYKADGNPLIIFAGQEYGTGSSRDWAAKGTNLLGVKAVVAQSFERIHRSNLVGMGVLPLQFPEGITAQTLKLDGTETFDVLGLRDDIEPRQDVTLRITRKDGQTWKTVKLPHRYAHRGGLLPARRHFALCAAAVAELETKVRPAPGSVPASFCSKDSARWTKPSSPRQPAESGVS